MIITIDGRLQISVEDGCLKIHRSHTIGDGNDANVPIFLDETETKILLIMGEKFLNQFK